MFLQVISSVYGVTTQKASSFAVSLQASSSVVSLNSVQKATSSAVSLQASSSAVPLHGRLPHLQTNSKLVNHKCC